MSASHSSSPSSPPLSGNRAIFDIILPSFQAEEKLIQLKQLQTVLFRGLHEIEKMMAELERKNEETA
jgi:hypothetical protein